MPFVNIELVRYLARFADDFDIVIPVSETGLEPLHSFYSRDCIPHIEEQMQSKNLKIIDFFPYVTVREVMLDEMRGCDPEGLSYFNINTPEKYQLAMDKLEEPGNF
jgi:molybdopterin-guanine dinucleotide biosynthesis protein A